VIKLFPVISWLVKVRPNLEVAMHVPTLIDDQPWRRAYVVLKPGARDSFVASE